MATECRAASPRRAIAAEKAIVDDAVRRSLSVLIDAVDGVLDELENLHLLDQRQVPPGYGVRLQRLVAILPADLHSDLRAEVSIAGLMASLYRVLGKLMARRSRRQWGEAAHEQSSARTRTERSSWSMFLAGS
jgi:hypothetical protein